MNYINFIELVTNSKKLIFNVLLCLLLVYFIFHSIYGNRGVIAYFKLNQQLEKSYNELDSLRSKRIELEHTVTLLRPASLDRDMLDQCVRKTLGLALPKEQVFTVDNTQ